MSIDTVGFCGRVFVGCECVGNGRIKQMFKKYCLCCLGWALAAAGTWGSVEVGPFNSSLVEIGSNLEELGSKRPLKKGAQDFVF